MGKALQMYPYNVMEYALSLYDNVDIGDFTPKGVQQLLADTLSDRERQVIEMYFRDGLTYERIGKQIGVTGERVRQIIERAMRVLRNRKKLKEYMAVPYLELVSAQQEKEKAEKRLDWLLEHTEYRVPLESPHQLRRAEAEECPLSTLGLPVYVQNTLNRRGVNTIGDLLAIRSEKDLLKMRDIDRKSCYDILTQVHRAGLKMAWETEPADKDRGADDEAGLLD